MVSLWINKTLTINGPNLLSLYSPSTSHFVSLLVSAPFLWKTFSPYIFPLLSWNVQSQEKCNLRTLSHSRWPTNRSKNEGKVFFQCTCKVMQTVFVWGLSHCPFAVEVADLSRLFVQCFLFFHHSVAHCDSREHTRGKLWHPQQFGVRNNNSNRPIQTTS